MNGDGYGPMAMPGTYTVSLSKRVDGEETELVPPTSFEVEPLGLPTLPPADREAILAFQKQTGRLQRAVMGAGAAAGEAANRLSYIKRTIEMTPGLDASLRTEARTLEVRLMDLREGFSGDRTLPRRSEPAPPGIMGRIQQIVFGHWSSTSAPTATHRKNYEIAEAAFSAMLDDLRRLVEQDLVALEQRLEAAGAPWTPGRGVPRWQRTTGN